MLTKTIRIKDNTIYIPELENYRGKMVEITVKEKVEKKERNLKKFLSLCGEISIKGAEIDRLREKSYI